MSMNKGTEEGAEGHLKCAYIYYPQWPRNLSFCSVALIRDYNMPTKKLTDHHSRLLEHIITAAPVDMMMVNWVECMVV